MIYNEFVLSDRAVAVPLELKASIVRSRVLAACRDRARTRDELHGDLIGVVQALTARIDTPATDEQTVAALDAALTSLVDEGLLAESDTFTLTEEGRETVLEHSAQAERFDDQFRASIGARLESSSSPSADSSGNAGDVIVAFFKKAIDRRALGVALTFANGGLVANQDFHMVALLQQLGEWIDAADDESVALAVVETIEDVFRNPSEAEKTYIATSVQARFVLHLLSLDADSLAIRRDDLARSLFLVDASTIIPALARGSVGHSGARSIVDRLLATKSSIATTWPLAEEVAEHARWAQKLLRKHDLQSTEVLGAITGRAGAKTNAFLEGFVAYVDEGGPSHFDSYLAECLGTTEVSNPLNDAEVSIALEKRGISVLDFDALAMDREQLAAVCDGYFRQIKEGRQNAGTYRHDRQVRAEAEAVALIDLVRADGLEIEGRAAQNAHFVTYTSLLDRVAASELPITLRPEAVISWLAALAPVASEDVEAIASELLWELQERRMNLVDNQQLLRVFGPLVSSARDRLEEALSRYRVLNGQEVAGTAGPEEEVHPLEGPIVLESTLFDLVRGLEDELVDTQKELRSAKQAAEMSEADRDELDRSRNKARKRSRYERMIERRNKR